MTKTIQRPLACRNAHCGAMCSPADASFMRNPSECYNYERRDDLYQKNELLDKVKKAREEIEEKAFTEEIFDEDIFNSTNTESVSRETVECESYVETEVVRLSDILEILDRLIAEREKE